MKVVLNDDQYLLTISEQRERVDDILELWDREAGLEQYPALKGFLRQRLGALLDSQVIPFTPEKSNFDPLNDIRGGRGKLEELFGASPQIYDTGSNFGRNGGYVPPQVYDTAASFGVQQTSQYPSSGRNGGYVPPQVYDTAASFGVQQTSQYPSSGLIPPQVYDTAASFGQTPQSGPNSIGGQSGSGVASGPYGSYGQSGQYYGGTNPANYLAGLPFIQPFQNTIANNGNGGLLGGSFLTGANGRQSLFNVLSWVFGNGPWVGPQTYGGTIQGPVVSAIPTSVPTGFSSSTNAGTGISSQPYPIVPSKIEEVLRQLQLEHYQRQQVQQQQQQQQ
ncbi:hypothetical protein PPL_07595 [Heterostelium album PN500]|uniref:Uncharacterized protein n=1 Tax=Heterostelium pallidum (strain ATCC 26659 / Pp 5 / PN500) TaxID=670386 RepID=D3BGE4_HETP5|nr:hypothetical protein PPL_07595 [Heterostelium album PN500]EFA79544.1 hypothetical protein PPL_07595 [Heterostelium album PN500]|eukprot:XP_020431665.1 hypothetical protein PPL_07595 [Heterostelium album PN500]